MGIGGLMIAYYESLSTFKSHIENNVIVEEILDKMGQEVSPSVIRSWRNSLTEVYKVLSFSNLDPNIEVGIEYKLPISLKRVDFLIGGFDGVQDNVVVIELKQWSEVEKTDMPGIVKMQGRLYPHPSWQAYSYTQIMSYFNEAVELNNISFYPCAFLHNYKPLNHDPLLDDVYSDAISLAPVFMQSDYVQLKEFIERHIKRQSQKKLLFEIDNGKIRPSKMLVEALGNMLNQNPEFTLLDEQKIVAEYIYKLAKSPRRKDNKQVIIVEGGAGTGKTLIAIDTLARLITEKGYLTFFVSKSSYLRENFFTKLTKGIPRHTYLKTLFKGSGSFIGSSNNEFDCLIADEAHRLTEKTKRSYLYSGTDQVAEIIHASKVSVFFIDPKQQIDIKDHGSIETIKKWAHFYGADVHHHDDLKLKAQFRCNGSDTYVQWVDSLLYNEPFIHSDEVVDYDIKLFKDIHEMKRALADKNVDNKSRMISGDTFPWLSRNDKSKIDIKIGSFEAQWNKTPNFATNPNSFDEVGCIHTIQGMEFEYVGLIITDDLVIKNGQIETDYTQHPDKANEFKRPHKQKVDPEDQAILDTLIRNTYRVLFSRGQKGVYIYCTNDKMHDYLSDKIKQLNKGK
jgi:DUF2075 family protein